MGDKEVRWKSVNTNVGQTRDMWISLLSFVYVWISVGDPGIKRKKDLTQLHGLPRHIFVLVPSQYPDYCVICRDPPFCVQWVKATGDYSFCWW